MSSGQSTRNVPQPDRDYPVLPSDDGQQRIFLGRTGLGREVDARAIDRWVDVRYIDEDGVVRGFALNERYAGQLVEGLVQIKDALAREESVE